jgi:predicted nucleotidyltransferase
MTQEQPDQSDALLQEIGSILQKQSDRVLDKVVRRLRRALEPETIYVHGSWACGSVGPGHEIHLLVVVADSDEDFYARFARGFRAVQGIGWPVDMQLYTREEFDSRADLPVSFERTVRMKGRVLYAA